MRQVYIMHINSNLEEKTQTHRVHKIDVEIDRAESSEVRYNKIFFTILKPSAFEPKTPASLYKPPNHSILKPRILSSYYTYC